MLRLYGEEFGFENSFVAQADCAKE